MAGNIIAGTGFTIYVVNSNPLTEPLTYHGVGKFRSAATTAYGTPDPSIGGTGTLIYGAWNIGWVWN
jgi:hypothetical protein